YERAQSACELDASAETAQPGSVAGSVGCPVEPTVIQYSPTRFGSVAYDELARAANTTVLLGANAVELVTNSSARPVEEVVAATTGGARFSVRAGSFVLATGGIENARLLLASDGVVRGGIGNAHDLVGRTFMEHLYVDDAARIAVQPRFGARYAADQQLGRQ